MFAAEVQRLARPQEAPPLVWLCVEAAAISDLDYSAADMLRTTCSQLRSQGTRVVFANVYDTVWLQMERCGLIDEIGEAAFYVSIHAVVEDYKQGRLPVDP